MSQNLRNQRLKEKRMMNCGIEATIVEYRNLLDIDVKFATGEKREHVTYQNFELGKISPVHKKEIDYAAERLHETKKMNCGLEAEIIAYRNSADIDIQFPDKSVVEHVAYHRFKQGTILPPTKIHKNNPTLNSKVGTTIISSCGLKMTCTEYFSSSWITIEFEDKTVLHGRSWRGFIEGQTTHPHYGRKPLPPHIIERIRENVRLSEEESLNQPTALSF